MKADPKTTKPIGRGKSKTKKAQGTLKVIAPMPAEEKLTIANTELAFQNKEKEKRAAELVLANKELVFQKDEKEKRAAELVLADKELAFQNDEKEKRAAELVIANRELAFQNHEKEKRADELLMANKELAFQNEEKEKRAAELAVANEELLYQNEEKEKRATELAVAYKELVFQNEEKEKRAAELAIANRELTFQNHEKEKRADELLMANKELAFQNDEKEKRAAELVVANSELKRMAADIGRLKDELEQKVLQRTAELQAVNRELEAFAYSVSHDLRAPLRGIDGWSLALLEDYHEPLDEQGRGYLNRVRAETQRMGQLIDDILEMSRVTRAEMREAPVNLSALAQAVAAKLQETQPPRQAEWVVRAGLSAKGDPHLLEIMLTNLLSNAFKFTGKVSNARIEFGQTEWQGKQVFFVRDNGAGFDMAYAKKLFGAFQRMHKASEFPGTGVGLATVQRIIHRHGGQVWAESALNQGTTFYFTCKEIL